MCNSPQTLHIRGSGFLSGKAVDLPGSYKINL
jgi:hypothetical protein